MCIRDSKPSSTGRSAPRPMRRARKARFDMDAQRLVDTARALVAGDRGLLAMDESTPTCDKRFAKLGIARTAEMRRSYRDMIVTTPNLGRCISGAILYDETIRQQT